MLKLSTKPNITYELALAYQPNTTLIALISLYMTAVKAAVSLLVSGYSSLVLFNAHQEQAYKASFLSPDGNNEVNISMVGFIDNSMGTCNGFWPQ